MQKLFCFQIQSLYVYKFIFVRSINYTVLNMGYYIIKITLAWSVQCSDYLISYIIMYIMAMLQRRALLHQSLELSLLTLAANSWLRFLPRQCFSFTEMYLSLNCELEVRIKQSFNMVTSIINLSLWKEWWPKTNYHD